MPKIFLTGSGISKGYVTGSGYLNNPFRTTVRDRDNLTGTYPTIHRMNRKDNSGILPNVLFNDDHVVNFGTRIKDNFDISLYEDYIQDVDPKKWVSTTGVVVKREFNPSDDFSITTGAVVLGGAGDSEGRWIRTKNKVSKPTLYFDITCGPYNNTNNGVLSAFKMRLGQGAITDVLKIQVSTAGTSGTWTTLPIKTSHISSNASQDLISGDGFSTKGTLYGVNANTAGQTTTVAQENKPVLKVKIDIVDFAELGFHDPFYIRFVQPSISDINNTVWAIGHIDIISRQDQVKYPTLSKVDDSADGYFDAQFVASPNVYNGLVTTGSARPRSIVRSTIENEQSNSPFDESNTVNSVNSEFYRSGTKSSVYPGFSSPTLNKTKFEIDLSPSSPTTLGLTAVYDHSEDRSTSPEKGQQVMVYWDKSLKKWSKIGKNIDMAITRFHPDRSYASILTGSNIGFISNLSTEGIRNGDGDIDYLSTDAFSLVGKPTDTFCFPFGPQYQANSNQVIYAKDLGITKPFLLEKTSLKYDLKIELPYSGSDYWSQLIGTAGQVFDQYYTHTYAPKIINPNINTSHIEVIDGLVNIIPTFFILRQFKSYMSSSNSLDITIGNDLNSSGNVGTLEIPQSLQMTSGSSDLTYVDTVRELVTYKNAMFSFEFDNFTEDFSKNDYIDVLKVSVDDFVPVDLNHSNDLGGSVTSYTGSFKLDSPSKLSSKYNPSRTQTVYVTDPAYGASSFSYKLIGISKQSPGRKDNSIDANRGIIDNYGSFEISTNEVVIDPNDELDPPITTYVPESKDSIKTSPYIIMPDDELILGWQYPWPGDNKKEYAFTNNDSFGLNSMTLFGSSKLTLYGSQIKDGKEFHEGLNQNLTSNAVHEAIGNEPVIDQWEISSREEMSGSHSDQFGFSTLDTEGNASYVFGKNITFYDTELKNTVHANYVLGTLPSQRLKAAPYEDFVPSAFTYPGNVLLISSFITDSELSSRFNSDFGALCIVPQINRFESFVASKRKFNDAGTKLQINSTSNYGTLQTLATVQNLPGAGYKNLGGRPKYYYSNKHYGHFSDNIRQGLDSKFERVLKRGNSITDPVVKIQFVTEVYDNENFNYRSFKRAKPSDIDGTSYESFQSSNLSIHAVSTVPFFDDGVVRNREYGLDTVEISE